MAVTSTWHLIWRGLAVAALLSLPIPSDAAEQGAIAAADEPHRFGLRPAVTISDIGFNTNILTTAQGQESDTTATLKVQLEPWARVGPARISGSTALQWKYFQRHDYERSLDAADSLRIDIQARRLSAYASGGFLRTRDPFDPEIYTRSERTERMFESGAEYGFSGKTSAALMVQESRMAFDAASAILGSGLREALNRRRDTVTVSVRNAVTALTTVSVVAGARRERLGGDVGGAADSVHLLAGLDLKPRALLEGKAYLGYRQLASSPETGQGVGGLVGSVDLGYVVADSFKWSAQMERDVARSFRLSEPYVTSTLVSSSLSRAISSVWMVTASAGRQWLDYGGGRVLPVAAIAAVENSGVSFDTMIRYSAETTRRLNRRTDITFTADFYRLHSHLVSRPYDRLRVLGAVVHRF
jgi:hypothetical protein